MWLKDDNPEEEKDSDEKVGAQHLPAEHRLRKLVAYSLLILFKLFLKPHLEK